MAALVLGLLISAAEGAPDGFGPERVRARQR
jgi:hypothetical protein